LALPEIVDMQFADPKKTANIMPDYNAGSGQLV
jgi:hypothetical protein